MSNNVLIIQVLRNITRNYPFRNKFWILSPNYITSFLAKLLIENKITHETTQ